MLCVVGSFGLCVTDFLGLCYVLYVNVDCVKSCWFMWSVLCVVGYSVDRVMCCRFLWIFCVVGFCGC